MKGLGKGVKTKDVYFVVERYKPDIDGISPENQDLRQLRLTNKPETPKYHSKFQLYSFDEITSLPAADQPTIACSLPIRVPRGSLEQEIFKGVDKIFELMEKQRISRDLGFKVISVLSKLKGTLTIGEKRDFLRRVNNLVTENVRYNQQS